MVPILQEAVWAPRPVWTGGKCRPPGIRPRTIQPVVIHYTDWATRTRNVNIEILFYLATGIHALLTAFGTTTGRAAFTDTSLCRE